MAEGTRVMVVDPGGGNVGTVEAIESESDEIDRELERERARRAAADEERARRAAADDSDSRAAADDSDSRAAADDDSDSRAVADDDSDLNESDQRERERERN